MGFVWGAVAAAAIGAASSSAQSRAAASSQRRALVAQQRQFDVSRTDIGPYRAAGEAALSQMLSLSGQRIAFDKKGNTIPLTPGMTLADLPPGSTILGDERFDPNLITRTPGYQFRLGQGQTALDRSLGARGRLVSGQALRGAQTFGQNLATGEFTDYYNRLASLAGLGQTSTQSLGQLGQAGTTNLANIYGNIGSAQAAGIGGQNQAIQGGLSNLILMNYLNQNQNPQSAQFQNYSGTWSPNG
jgi:hypothetical protein